MTLLNWVLIIAAYLWIFFFINISSSFAEKAPYSSFAKDATSATKTEYFDYIIVGGGTAGCALASTLSTTAKVLLLERGGLPYNNPNVTHETGFLASLLDTSPRSATQQFISTDGVPNHRGCVLGGGSAINVGFYSRADGKKPKACGVVFRDSQGTNHTIFLNNNAMSEIILSAGALGSPQLLMLSGIGPAHHLKAHGINVILDQPMVGQGMSDNPANGILAPSPRPVKNSVGKVVGIRNDIGCYIESVSGLFGAGLFSTTNRSLIQSGLIIKKVARPFSTGFLELQSNDPNENPRVTFNYFQDPRDLQMCVQSMEIVRRVVESNAFSEFRYPNTTFESLVELMLELSRNRKRTITRSHSLEQFCVDTVMTMWHYHGGCQVGRVVDSDYRVIGLDSLRVIDGSTFYDSPGTNPQATLMMLGRYMGQKIRQQFDLLPLYDKLNS